MSKETLEAVNAGILTDKQLDEAIKHFTELTILLKPHDLYRLTYNHARSTLETLEYFKEARKRK
jgi:sRNA-binding regulator protein Hfq